MEVILTLILPFNTSSSTLVLSFWVSHLGCDQSPVDWGRYQQPRGWKSKIGVPAWSGSEWPPADLSLYPHKAERGQEIPWVPSVRALIEFMGLHPHDLITSQRPLPPNTIPSGFRVSTGRLGEHKDSVYNRVFYLESHGEEQRHPLEVGPWLVPFPLLIFLY